MPRSKRARVVHTSRVQKKPSKEKSLNLYTTLRALLPTTPTILLISITNMRNTHLKTIRQSLAPDSRLFFGKTKVMAKALGSTEEDEAMPGLHNLTPHLKGDVGLILTSKPVGEVRQFLDEFVELDYARAGTVAPRRFVVPAGVVYSRGGEADAEENVPLPHSMEAQVRGWGMPTRLEKGRVTLGEEYVVCEEGDTLNSNQTALLKTFGVQVAEFKVNVVAWWEAESGEVNVADGAEAMDED